MKANHLKHKEDREWYHSYDGEKATYSNFINRLYLWYSRDESIQPWKMKMWKDPKNEVSNNGRVCNKCLQFKLWSEFSKARTMWSPNRRTSDCKQCRNDYKRQYREKSNRHQEYRQSKRHPEIWSKIAVVDYIHYDDMGNPREVVWDVIEYIKNKWYRLVSEQYWLDKTFSFLENKTSHRFYRIEEEIIQEEKIEKDLNKDFSHLLYL